MPVLALILSAILSKPVLANSCVFNDSGMVNVPGEIRVPATLPIGSVIATGQADINISCQVDNPETGVMLYFSRLRRCGDSDTWLPRVEGTPRPVSVEMNMEMVSGASCFNEKGINDDIFDRGQFSETYQTQYPGVGIRMQMIVKGMQNLIVPPRNGNLLELGVGPTGERSSRRVMGPTCRGYLSGTGPQYDKFANECEDPVNKRVAANRIVGSPPIKATQYGFQGQLLVELVKIRHLVWTGNPFVASGGRGGLNPSPSPSNQIAHPYQNFLDHVLQVGLSGARTPGTWSAGAARAYGAFDKESIVGSGQLGQIYGTKAYRLATRIIDTAACDIVGSKNITVNMGQTATTTLDNNATPEIPFQITLNCPAGARARLTFTDSSNPNNQTDKLGLSASSAASGLALQLRSNGRVINFAPDTTIAANAVRVDESGIGGVVTVPLTAQVVKTGTVKPGQYTAQSTVTVSYQ